MLHGEAKLPRQDRNIHLDLSFTLTITLTQTLIVTTPALVVKASYSAWGGMRSGRGESHVYSPAGLGES